MFPSGIFSEGIGAGLLGMAVLFVLFLAIFARGATGWVLLGFLKVLWATLAEPITYLSRMVHQFSGVGKGRTPGATRVGHGLLPTFLFYLQVVLVVGAIGVLSAGAYLSWNALHPPADAEKYLEITRKELAEIKQNLDSSQLSLKGLEGNLAQKKSEAMTMFKGERQKTIQAADLEMANAEKAVQKDANLSDALVKIKAFLADKSAPTNTWEPSDAKEKVETYLSNNVIADYAAKAPLQTYIEQWHKKMVAQVELATFNEAQITRQMEQEHQELAQRVASLQADFKTQGQIVERAADAASLRFGAALLTLILTFGQFIGFIWVAGLCLELFEKALQFFAHVADIRHHLVPEGPASDTAADLGENTQA